MQSAKDLKFNTEKPKNIESYLKVIEHFKVLKLNLSFMECIKLWYLIP